MSDFSDEDFPACSDGLGELPLPGPRRPLWVKRKDVSDLWTPIGVVLHKRIQVVTHDGRRIEFEQIHWTNGTKVVSAYDETFDRLLHYFSYKL